MGLQGHRELLRPILTPDTQRTSQEGDLAWQGRPTLASHDQFLTLAIATDDANKWRNFIPKIRRSFATAPHSQILPRHTTKPLCSLRGIRLMSCKSWHVLLDMMRLSCADTRSVPELCSVDLPDTRFVRCALLLLTVAMVRLSQPLPGRCDAAKVNFGNTVFSLRQSGHCLG